MHINNEVRKLNSDEVIINNKFGKSFGPVGSAIGIFLLLTGLILSYSVPGGLFLVFIGAYLGFTTTATLIDTDKKRIKYSNNIFGVIPYGKWLLLKPEMKIQVKKSHTGYRSYSRSNRILDIHVKDFRIILIGADNKEIMPVKKFETLEEAQAELESLKIKLGLG